MDREELELFRASVDQAAARHRGKALDDALGELGWQDALHADRRAAVATLFDAQGRANTTSSALDRVVATALGVDAAVGVDPAVVLPRLRRTDPPGEVVGESVTIRGLGTAALQRGDRAAVVVDAAVVIVDPSELTLRPVDGLDPAAEMVKVSADGVDVITRSELPATAWAAAVAAGQVAVAHELVGGSRTMLDVARQHALERIQFGRPIAAFQAVRHRLAESLVAIQAAEAALDAWWEFESPMTAALAKVVAGRSARTVARHCQQVLAGIGFTTEHPFHRYLRRTLVLDALLGDARSLTNQLGEDLLRTKQFPLILPL